MGDTEKFVNLVGLHTEMIELRPTTYIPDFLPLSTLAFEICLFTNHCFQHPFAIRRDIRPRCEGRRLHNPSDLFKPTVYQMVSEKIYSLDANNHSDVYGVARNASTRDCEALPFRFVVSSRTSKGGIRPYCFNTGDRTLSIREGLWVSGFRAGYARPFHNQYVT
jgi:hypothetical protein